MILVPAISFAQYGYERCIVPTTLRGEWFSREDGQNVVTRISENEFSDRGFCMEMVAHSYDNFTFLLKKADCLSCVRILIRTLNVMEKIESWSFEQFCFENFIINFSICFYSKLFAK